MTKRENYLDMAKGLCIIMVVLGHELTWDDPLRYSIYCFHIPMFFILSGIVMGLKNEVKKDKWEFVTNNIKALIRPYIIISGIYIVYHIVKMIFESDISIKTCLSDVIQVVSGYGINVLWFLSALCGGKVLFYFLNRICNGKYTKIKFVITVIVGIATIMFVRKMSGLLDDSLVSKTINYFMIGILRPIVVIPFIFFGCYIYPILNLLRRKKVITMICACMIAIIIIPAIYNYKITLVILESNPIWGAYVFGFISTIAVLSVCILLEKVLFIQRFLSFWGINSLFLMVTHEYIPIRGGTQELLSLLIDNYFLLILLTLILVLCVDYILFKLIKNIYYVWILGKK